MTQTSRYLRMVVAVELGPFSEGQRADLPGTQGTWLGHVGPQAGRTEMKCISIQKRNSGTKTRTWNLSGAMGNSGSDDGANVPLSDDGSGC